MPPIQIVATPPGEEPEVLRRAWIGLVLPLVAGHPPGPVAVQSQRGGPPWLQGYVVDGCAAVEILSQYDPATAAWWRAACPACLKPGPRFLFPADVCLLLDDEGRVVRPLRPESAGDLPDPWLLDLI